MAIKKGAGSSFIFPGCQQPVGAEIRPKAKALAAAAAQHLAKAQAWQPMQLGGCQPHLPESPPAGSEARIAEKSQRHDGLAPWLGGFWSI